ncbi:hypothetical protein PAMA_014199 [Pampus argenteus]
MLLSRSVCFIISPDRSVGWPHSAPRCLVPPEHCKLTVKSPSTSPPRPSHHAHRSVRCERMEGSDCDSKLWKSVATPPNPQAGFRGSGNYPPPGSTHIDRSVFNPSLTTSREEAPEIDHTVTAERENAVIEIVTPELEIPLAVNPDVPAPAVAPSTSIQTADTMSPDASLSPL